MQRVPPTEEIQKMMFRSTEEIQKMMFRFIAESEARTYRRMQHMESRCWGFVWKVFLSYTIVVFILQLLVFSILGYHHVVL